MTEVSTFYCMIIQELYMFIDLGESLALQRIVIHYFY